VLQRLLFDLDIQQHQRVQTERAVLPYAVVEAVRFPRVGEEGHRDRLAEMVELQACDADGVQDRGVGDRACGDVQFARA
ncbi:MAG: hypothetical protein Q9191_006962, partial [Dirinaria sp. TL-2023a]